MVEMAEKAEIAARFLKGIANAHRLAILCELSKGERNVSELMQVTGIPQTSISQHLAKLRDENIVSFRREHRSLYYRITHQAIIDIMEILYREFCQTDDPV